MKLGVPRVSLTDTIGAAAVLLIGAGGYLLLLQRPLEECGRLPIVREAAAQAARDLAAVQSERERLRREVEESDRKLASVGGGLPESREIDRYLARVMAAAADNGISIDTLSPSPATEQGDHREVRVNFVGRGSFVGFQRMLRAIEHDLEYADVTHFSVASGAEGSESLCRLSWSLRIHTNRDGPPARTVLNAKSP